MKKILFGFMACWMAVQLTASADEWMTSLPDAQAKAAKEKKLVLMDFTGSDWCMWCHKMHEEVFAKPEFLNYAKTNVVLVVVDFPARLEQSPNLKAANEALKDKYKVSGYPTLIALKPDGKVVWTQQGYLAGGTAAMIAKLDEAKKK